ncbi:hypothetical protein SESBI_43237 [Sesbania bispinosa]|nr:hypothetical protein SESBI_43237 [Sesbania bispinosa]
MPLHPFPPFALLKPAWFPSINMTLSGSNSTSTQEAYLVMGMHHQSGSVQGQGGEVHSKEAEQRKNGTPIEVLYCWSFSLAQYSTATCCRENDKVRSSIGRN